MSTSLYQPSLYDLLWLMTPIVFVVFIYIRWTSDKIALPLALARMVLQLIMIGYVLTYIFTSNSSYLVLLTLSVMLIAASMIALRPLQKKEKSTYIYAFVSIFLGSSLPLGIVMIAVLEPPVWYDPPLLIPLAGMTFANAMNAVSIAAERYESERAHNYKYKEARALAIKAALIPIINALFAVGLVSLPGMMTGQILSGIDPLIAARYQMMVMLMILSSAGLSVAIYLKLEEKF